MKTNTKRMPGYHRPLVTCCMMLIVAVLVTLSSFVKMRHQLRWSHYEISRIIVKKPTTMTVAVAVTTTSNTTKERAAADAVTLVTMKSMMPHDNTSTVFMDDVNGPSSLPSNNQSELIISRRRSRQPEHNGTMMERQHLVGNLNSTTMSSPICNTNTTTTTSTTVSIVVPLNGEMGNHLTGIAHGLAVQYYAARQAAANAFGNNGIDIDSSRSSSINHHNSTTTTTTATTRLILRNSGSGREGGPRDTKRCFPYFANVDFEEGNTAEYEERVVQQQHLAAKYINSSKISSSNQNVLPQLVIKEYNAINVGQALTTVLSMASIDPQQQQQHRNETNEQQSWNSTFKNNISLPFLTVEGDFVVVDESADLFYDVFRRVFAFDGNACCKRKPDADESVFHIRNFQREMGAFAAMYGYDELDPNRTAQELFGHLGVGEKLAITSRFATDHSVQPFVDALTQRGIRVRVITDQSGVEDFCFMLHAKKELVGMAESTFALWAGYLGNATKVYSIDSPGRRKSPFFSHRVYVHYNWTHPSLKEKVYFELYQESSAS